MNGEKKKFFRIIDKIEDICLVTLFAAMVASIFLQIIMRFVFNNSLTWSEELGKFIFVWISWLGISIGARRKEHIAITMVVDRLSPKLKLIFGIISNLILIGILGVTLYYAVILVQAQQHVPYAGIKISTSWGYLSLVLGCLFMGLRLIGNIVMDVKTLIKGDSLQIEGGAN
ncbi:TRAP-type C4-dicarboxylate transport system permease small subunit [Clostridiales Family XIII bacterium PM5-7]